MGFYELHKDERAAKVKQISKALLDELRNGQDHLTLAYCSDEDTYIRKAAYLSFGRLYLAHKPLQRTILQRINQLLEHEDSKVRQSAIHAAGEIGKSDFACVQAVFDKGLFDAHHSPRNAVIGSVKKMGEVNPGPVLAWARNYLKHPDKEIRREICHGIELRGRKYPQDILPMLQELEHDSTARVKNTLVHVLGQIAYKQGCLQTVIAALNSWNNKALVEEAIEEIIDVHHRYRNFSALTQQEAIRYIDNYYKK